MPEALERASRVLGLGDAALGQRTLIVGQAVGGIGVAQQPEHAGNCSAAPQGHGISGYDHATDGTPMDRWR